MSPRLTHIYSFRITATCAAIRCKNSAAECWPGAAHAQPNGSPDRLGSVVCRSVWDAAWTVQPEARPQVNPHPRSSGSVGAASATPLHTIPLRDKACHHRCHASKTHCQPEMFNTRWRRGLSTARECLRGNRAAHAKPSWRTALEVQEASGRTSRRQARLCAASAPFLQRMAVHEWRLSGKNRYASAVATCTAQTAIMGPWTSLGVNHPRTR